MQIEQAIEPIKACWEKEAPFCTDACPFRLDVREFTTRMRRGSMNSAFRTFSNGVAFPALVARLCPRYCEAACPRQQTDAPLRLNLLEQAACALAANTKPNSYNLPLKQGRFAIVGAGVSGLACCLRLCNRKYRVTVFEQSDSIGGQLLHLLPPDEARALLEREFIYESYDLRLNQRVDDPSALLKPQGEFDAVYIATGADGDGFGLRPLDEGRPAASTVDGLFLGGSLLGADVMHALAQGLEAASLLESYLKTQVMRSAAVLPPTRTQLDPQALTFSAPVLPTDGVAYTKEEAMAEATRCIGCRCDACFRHCPLLKHADRFPLRLSEEVRMSVHPVTLDHDGTVASRLISTCTHCGLCKEVCPQHIDLGQFLLHAHRLMQEKPSWPWAFHQFWLRDMQHARSERAFFLGAPQSSARYLFFPGCRLGASDPRYVREGYRWLRRIDDSAAVLLSCCGAPAVWAGDEQLQNEVFEQIRSIWQQLGQPTLALACPSCLRMFRDYLPELPACLLTDIACEQGVAVQPLSGEWAVFDPCALRDFPEQRQHIRALLTQAGCDCRELPYAGERAQCCSFGGQIDMTDPPHAQRQAAQCAAESGLPYVVSCVNCRDILGQQGKQVRHILDLLLHVDSAPQQDNVSQTLLHREQARRLLVEEFFPERADGLREYTPQLALRLADGVAERMAAERVRYEDAEQVVAACERDGNAMRDEQSGHLFGYRRIGPLTCWAEYAVDPAGGYVLHDAYQHRMMIEGSEDHE